MKINEVIGEQIDWNALWKAGAVMPYLLKSKQNPNPLPPGNVMQNGGVHPVPN